MQPRILFVLKYRETPSGSYGWGDGYGPFLHSGLYNSATFVCDMLQAQGFESKLVHVLDNNKIHKEIVEYGATHVIIEAFWVVPQKFIELAKVCPQVKFIIRNHSETPFLATEGIAFEWKLAYFQLPNVIMSCNAPRMLEETRFLFKTMYPNATKRQVEEKVPYLPNYYPIYPDEEKYINPHAPTVRVGCFGAIRPLKNHMTQAIAAMKFAERQGKNLEFHINGNRIEGRGDAILKNLNSLFAAYDPARFKLVNHAWMPHTMFKEVVKKMDIVSQVSFTETFNIVGADAVSQGVPFVTTKEVAWASPLTYADPTESDDIADRYDFVYNLKKWVPGVNLSLGGLKNYNKKSVKIWGNYFTKD